MKKHTVTPTDIGKRFSQNVRREFIIRQIRARGMMSLARLNQEAKTPPSHSVLREDLDVINRSGFHIVAVESEGRTYLVDASARHISAKAIRMDLNATAKEDVAIAAASLVFGLPDRISSREQEDAEKNPDLSTRRGRLCATNPEIRHWWTETEVYEALVTKNAFSAASKKAQEVWDDLRRVWGEGVITVFCDAGTTNERYGSLMRDVLVPTSFSSLNSVSLCTNSRSIFNAVADPEVPTKAIAVGGCQMGVDGVTEALAGPLSEAFLKATVDLLSFSFAFLGTTAIDVGAGFILSDSHEEKNIKGMVTSRNRSLIRAICTDRTKICSRPVRAGYRFCSISPSELDVIITNAPVEGNSSPDEEHISRLIGDIRRRGVPVIEARFETTRRPVAEMQRGQLFRSRLPYHKAEALFGELGFGKREDLPFQSRAMEIWLNAVTDYFLDEAPEDVRGKLISKVAELRKDTFLGQLMENTARIERLKQTEE